MSAGATATIALQPERGLLEVRTDPPTRIPIGGPFRILRLGQDRGSYFSLPMHFTELVKLLSQAGFDVKTRLRTDVPIGLEVKMATETRPYQEQAYLRWAQAGCKGVIVMPTGAGKTFVALRAVAELRQATLIVVPTIDLMHQWHRNICANFTLLDSQVARWGGGYQEMGPLTVITYESGAMHASRMADRFGLIVFDEVHHLPAESFRRIAEESIAPRRMGLTATPERVDNLERDLDFLVGKVVYSISKEELERKSYVASFRQERVLVDLTAEERAQYERMWRTYKQNLKAVFARTRGPRGNPIQMLVRRLPFDPHARVALDSWRRARRIALEADSKVDQVERLLKRYRDRKVLIFSEYISIVNRIARKFGVPKITSTTPLLERKKILQMFREGRITKLVSGKVLDEGVDVPDASVGIIVSGSSTKRQYIQRLGRLLRPKDIQAVLIEIVSMKTTEMQASERRKRPVRF